MFKSVFSLKALLPDYSFNWFWMFVSLFLVIWLGHQILTAAFHQEILNLRTTNSVSLTESPFWFSFVVLFKFTAWSFALWYFVSSTRYLLQRK